MSVLPTALGFVEMGWEVIGADDDASKVAMIQSGRRRSTSLGSTTLLARGLASGRLTLSHCAEEAVRAATILFVCVGTPQKDTGEADLSQVEAIVRIIARNLNGYKLIVEKSTVPAITAQWIKKTVARFAKLEARGRLHAEFDVASNPEFLQEGRAVENIFHPDRIVVGVESERARELVGATLSAAGMPDSGHQHQHGGVDQARGKRISVHQNFLHQHGGRYV